MTKERIKLEEGKIDILKGILWNYELRISINGSFKKAEQFKSQILQDHEIVNRLQWEIDKIQTVYEIDHGLTDEQQSLLVLLQKIMENKK